MRYHKKYGQKVHLWIFSFFILNWEHWKLWKLNWCISPNSKRNISVCFIKSVSHKTLSWSRALCYFWALFCIRSSCISHLFLPPFWILPPELINTSQQLPWRYTAMKNKCFLQGAKRFSIPICQHFSSGLLPKTNSI